MATVEDTQLTEQFEQFYRNYYHDTIAELAQNYPTQRSLYIDWDDLYRFDPTIADDYLTQPDQLKNYAENALTNYDLPIDVTLNDAHVRIHNLPEITDIRAIRSPDVNTLVSIQGIVRKATDVRPKINEAAFECQRCGTLTHIPQTNNYQEPHQCQGCERQGPFAINYDQSSFEDAQKLRIQESPEGLRGGETPQSIDIHIEDDIAGNVTPGDHVTITGALRIEQQTSGNEKSRMFDVYMDGHSLTIEDEEFENMDITQEDKQTIIDLSQQPDIYQQMVDSIAPSIYGYDDIKLAMILQLFSGVTKHLPDNTRLRGDLHMLLIGDPGTGKCTCGDTLVKLSDGTDQQIRTLVEEHLTDPIPVDDGVYQEVDFTVPSLQQDGSILNQDVTKVWKREAPEYLLQIETSAGRTIKVTPSHPLFVHDTGRFKPIKAENLNAGEFIAAPRKLNLEGDDTLDIPYRRSQSSNAVRVQLPDEWTPSLARLVGYLIGEGDVRQPTKHGGDARVTNADEEIIEDVTSAYEALELPYSIDSLAPTTPARAVRCNSGEFVSFLKNLEPTILELSKHRLVPDPVKQASKKIKRAFLKAYVEGEGTVSRKEREISVGSMSRELLEGVQSLLLSFGISSQLRERSGGIFRLRISGDDAARYAREIGFVTDRKSEALDWFEDVDSNTNTDVIPVEGGELRRIRTALGLSQFDVGIPRTTYQHYERGDRNPSREALRNVVSAFEDRLAWLQREQQRLNDETWNTVVDLRGELNQSQAAIAEAGGMEQTMVSYHERNGTAPEVESVGNAGWHMWKEIDQAVTVEADVQRLRQLVDSDIAWERIESIESVEPDYEWVYDLEVEGTHNYISNGIISHNSQLLQYIRHIAPRSIYSSGKGSSAAGLCVTGDTIIHTEEGLRPIRDIATTHHPDPVSREMSAEKSVGVYTFNREIGQTELGASSHVWRMPEKPCRRIETNYGKELEASVNTPVLTCGEQGISWKPISAVEAGEYVAVPQYSTVTRSSPSIDEFLELTNEKVKLADESLASIRSGLFDQFDTLRKAAAELGFSEDFIYEHLWNRYVPINKLDRILAAIGADRENISIDRAMLRHGNSIRIPSEFDEDLMYLIGLVFGDGDISVSRRGKNRGLVRISNSDETLLRRAARIVADVFDKQVSVEYQEDRVPCIRVNSATIARFFRNIGMRTPKQDLALNHRLTTSEHADAFIRGFMDADGSVSVRTNGGSSVHASSISEQFAQQLQLMLETFGIQAKRRKRVNLGTSELEDRHTISSNHPHFCVEIYGADIDRYAEAIGFESSKKAVALEQIVEDVVRREKVLPLGSALATVDGPSGQYWSNLMRGDNPGRGRARSLLEDRELGSVGSLVEETVEAELQWEEVKIAYDTGKKEVFDLTVPETHNFIGNGIVTHNTAAAIRDDFGDGQQWSLEAGALVLADKGIAAIDELDKMKSDDRSAMHESLEQQQISINKAGINATLKSRCALLGAANPKYGRFDQYEPIAEQIDLEPALISRFDLIFTVTDQPDEEEDRKLAEHILKTNYAGELNTQRTELSTPPVSEEDIEAMTADVEPAIDPDVFRKYIAYAKRNIFPSMSEAAKEAIRDFYVQLRSQGSSEDAPVPVTARKLEALVRLSEASARVRLSDTVEEEDAERVIGIVRACLQDIGVDPETGEFDADVIETGTSKSQRDRIKNLRVIIEEIEADSEDGAPVEAVIERAEEVGMDEVKVEHEIEKLKQRGEVYEPRSNHLRTT